MRRSSRKRARSEPPQGDALRAALDGIRPHFMFAAAFSFGVNILYLASPLYMLQIYDRVLSSGSLVTLIFVTVMLLLALATLGALDAIKSRILVLAGEALDEALAGRLMSRLVQAPTQEMPDRSGVLREFDALRSFISGQGIQVFFDAPWTPIFILVCALLHPLLGVFALFGALVLLAVAYVNECSMREAVAGAHESASRAYASAETTLGGGDAVRALGMRRRVVSKWLDDRSEYVSAAADAGRRGALFSGLAKFLRLALQSGALGVGAYLAIDGQITPGAMIAASILVGRALAPLEQVFGAWRSAGLAHGAYRRIDDVLRSRPRRGDGLRLPDPKGGLRVENLVVAASPNSAAILKHVCLNLEPGEFLGVIGPSGAGKSTLARALVGAWPARSGVVRLDGADIAQIDDEELGRHIGYMPQETQLFPGTIADNISRFERTDPDADVDEVDQEVLEAAQAADAHHMILELAKGYDTDVGPGAGVLSGGQRQRIALARALYRRPALLVLDEPNSHLDSDGERALLAALGDCKRRGRSIVLVTHRSAVLSQADKLLLLRDGAIADVGRRDDVVRRLERGITVPLLRGGSAA